MPKQTKQEKRKAFAYHVLNQLELVKGADMRPMFGGYGLYARSLFFGLIWQECVYFFTNTETRKRYKRYKSWPFEFREGCDSHYWAVPDTVLANPRKLAEWAEEALLARSAFEQSQPAKVKRKKKPEREVDEDRFY
jgi:DNA transformation protein